MSRVSFENYGRRASQGLSYAEMAGRYAFQADSEKNVRRDVIEKLALRPDDDLIEIGCGAGNLLIPLSERVRAAAGVDHPELLGRLKARAPRKRVRLVPGNFLDVRVPGRYSKVLVYSVVHYLTSQNELRRFLEKAAGLLKPGGRMLVGDIPNADRKSRFLASALGRRVQRDWAKRVRRAAASAPLPLPADRKLVRLDDRSLLGAVRHLRAEGYEAYLIPEPADLPFAYTREDMLVLKPAA